MTSQLAYSRVTLTNAECTTSKHAIGGFSFAQNVDAGAYNSKNCFNRTHYQQLH